MPRKKTPKASVRMESSAEPQAAADQLSREVPLEIRDAAKAHVAMAMSVLAQIANDKNAPHASRVSAALAIIERAEGKAPQAPQASAQSGPTAADLLREHA